MNTNTVRAKVAAQIKADNPKYGVVHYNTGAPSNLGASKVHVCVFRTRLEPVSGTLKHSLTIEVIVGGLTEGAQDFADTALDEVLLSLQRLDEVRFISADFSTFGETFIGYSINAEVDSADVYKSTIIEERSI